MIGAKIIFFAPVGFQLLYTLPTEYNKMNLIERDCLTRVRDKG